MPSDRTTARRPWPTALRIVSFVAVTMMGLATANAQEGAAGITQRTVFPAFDPNAPACNKPPGLAKVLAFVQENEREFLHGVDSGLAMAAKDRGLEYRRAAANNDAAKADEEIRSFLASKVGALVATSSDPAVVRHSLQEVIWSGAFVGGIVPPPATLLLNAPQYATGKALTDAAITYINTKLGGNAAVVLLTQDTLQFLTPRFEAMRDGLSKLPGVTIVADIAPRLVNKQSGFDTMNTILLANSDVDVVLGADTVVLGALQALRAAGKDRPDQFLGGIDGEPEAVSEIKKGNGPYTRRASLSPRPSSAMPWGSMRADWLEGKSVPQAMDILPIALTSAEHRPVRSGPRRSGSGIFRPGAARRLSQDVRQHLLRHTRPIREFSLVFRAGVVSVEGAETRRLHAYQCPCAAARLQRCGDISGRFGLQPLEDGQELRSGRLGDGAGRNLRLGPHPRAGGIVAHGPSGEETVGHRLAEQKAHVGVPVVGRDPSVSAPDGDFGPLDQLQVGVGAADEGAGHIVPQVVASRVHEDAIEHRLIEAERLRHIDDLNQTHTGTPQP